MKIAILTTDSREHFRDYARPAPYFGTAPEALLSGFAEIGGAEIHVVSCTRQPVRAPEKIADNIWYHALHVPKIGWLRTGYQGCLRAVRKKLRAIRPDIVHGQGTEHDCALCAVFSGFPNVVTIHGNMKALAEFYRAPFGNYYWLTARLETLALRRTGGVFCNSAFTENEVAPRARRTWRVPNAVRRDFFLPPAAARTSKNILLNLGVVCDYKRQLELVDVAERLHERGHAVEFWFAGACVADSPYGRAFLEKIRVAEPAGYARYLGVKNAGELVALLDTVHGAGAFSVAGSLRAGGGGGTGARPEILRRTGGRRTGHRRGRTRRGIVCQRRLDGTHGCHRTMADGGSFALRNGGHAHAPALRARHHRAQAPGDLPRSAGDRKLKVDGYCL